MTWPTVYVYAQTHLQLDFVITTPSGAPYDLTGVQQILWGLSANPEAHAFLQLNLQNGITITAPATAGKFSVDVSSARINGLRGCYCQQAQITDSSGNTQICYAGYIVFQPNIF